MAHMFSLLCFCTGLSLRASRTPLFASETSLLFATPISFNHLDSAFTPAALGALTSSILVSWERHIAEQAALPRTGERNTGDHTTVFRATSDQRLNDEFYYFQMREYGIDNHQSSPQGWLATAEAQALLREVADYVEKYLEGINRHAGMRTPSVSFHPDMLQAWANVHRGVTGTQPRHVHAGAVASCVFYAATPPGAASITFFDPRGSLPPLAGHTGMQFEGEVRHSPRAGDLLIFPPWLPHAVGCGDSPSDGQSHDGGGDNGPRVSISFNLIASRDQLTAWGEPTAALECSLRPRYA